MGKQIFKKFWRYIQSFPFLSFSLFVFENSEGCKIKPNETHLDPLLVALLPVALVETGEKGLLDHICNQLDAVGYIGLGWGISGCTPSYISLYNVLLLGC